MSRIKSITQHSNNRFLNLYELQAERRNGVIAPYYLASRSKTIENLKITTKKEHSDGVIIYGLYGEKNDKVVLVRQFRYPIDDYIYEFPAGLVEEGEDMKTAAIREIFEETGLHFTPIQASYAYSKGFYTTIGMTDESCGTIYGYYSGEPSTLHQEESEDIEVILADRQECKRILKEEKVAIMCAYMLMHFIHDSSDDPFAFLQDIED